MAASRLLLASRNPGKLLEIRALLDEFELALTTPDQLGLEVAVEESGRDYAENASLKARAYARESGIWALADDSGLEVQVLGGAPGLHSARLEEGTDADRRARLLALLAPHPPPWPAHFRSFVALAHPDGRVDLAHGACAGEIVRTARGTGGFGYDPIFQVQGTDKTMAELTLEEKNQVSHRARAIRALRPALRKRLGIGPSDPSNLH